MGALERIYPDLSRPVREFAFVVDAPEAGARLDTLLRRHYPWRSRAHFRRMLECGEALVNGRRGKPAYRVRRGDRVVVTVPVDPAAPDRESAEGLVILYEDEDLVVVDKPSGMAVHPVGRIRHSTLVNKLHARYRSEDPRRDVVPRLGHRLDRDTSGVVLAVKNRRTDALVTRAFTRRRVEKGYLALVRGVPAESEGLVDAPIGRHPAGATALHMRVDPAGQPARTRWTLERAFARHALLALEPLTGRTHQLRVHMAHLGHPILCDHLYGDLRPLLRSDEDPRLAPHRDGVLLERLALHARRLALDHPRTGRRLRIESPLPEDMARAIRALRALAAAVAPRDGAGAPA